MLIGVSGKMGTGKTTLAKIAKEEFGFTATSFAALLKSDLMCVLNKAAISFSYYGFYGTQEQKQELIWIRRDELPAEFNAKGFNYFCEPTDSAECYAISYRKLMQWYGAYKRTQNTDYWVERLMAVTDFSVPTIIDDIRYFNEAVMIQCLGGLLIRVNWPRGNESSHISETQLDSFPGFNCIINKTKTTSLAEYQRLCREQLAIYLGVPYDPRGNIKTLSG